MSDRAKQPGLLETLGIRLRNVTIRRYSGRGAERYETHRQSGRWKAEFAALRYFYRQVDPRRVLDLPAGTGRWFEIYQSNRASVLGVDISENMLREARTKVPPGADIKLVRADVLAPTAPNLGKDFDLIVCTRFVYWLRPHELGIMLTRLHATGAPFLLASAKVAIEGSEAGDGKGSTEGGLLHRLDRLRARFYRSVVKRVYREGQLLDIFAASGWRLQEKRLIVTTRNMRYFYYLFARV